MNKPIFRRTILVALSTLMLWPLTSSAEVFRWVDENGVVHYGDRVPPKYAKEKRDILNKRGIAVGTLDRQKTPEELKAEREKLEAEKAAEQAAKEQARYDRFLVGTYETVADIIDARDERLTTIDSRIGLTEKIVKDTEDSVAVLQQEAAAYRAKDKEPPARITKQMAEFDADLVSNLTALRRLRAEREEAVNKYKSDIERFKFLKEG